MAHRTTLSIHLTPDLEDFVSKKIASGRFQSASEVVQQGPRLLQGQETSQASALAQLRSQIDLGLDQAERGELLDGEEIFEELERRSRHR